MSEWVYLDEVARQVAEIAYPNMGLRKAQKIVRDRIRYAVKKGPLVRVQKGGRHRFARLDFFAWATQPNNWPEVAAQVHLPIRGGRVTDLLSLCAEMTAEVRVLPERPASTEELWTRYVEEVNRARTLSAQNSQLLRDLEVARAALDACERKVRHGKRT